MIEEPDAERERRLCEAMRNYLNRSGRAFDPKFRKALEAVIPTQPNDATPRKRQIMDFFSEHGRWPSRSSSDPGEHKLATCLTTYTSPSAGCYDPDFCEQIGWVSRRDRQRQIRAAIVEWVRVNGRRPNGRSVDIKERRFRQQMEQQVKLDKEFRVTLDALVPVNAEKAHTGRTEAEQADFTKRYFAECADQVKSWCEAHRRMPTPRGQEEKERYVYGWLCRHRATPEVATWFNNLPREMRFDLRSFVSRFQVLAEWVGQNERYPCSTAVEEFERRLFNFGRSARANRVFLSWFATLPDSVKRTTKIRL